MFNWNKNCFWGHSWTPWQHPYTVRIQYMYKDKAIGKGIEQRQKRACKRCFKDNVREV